MCDTLLPSRLLTPLTLQPKVLIFPSFRGRLPSFTRVIAISLDAVLERSILTLVGRAAGPPATDGSGERWPRILYHVETHVLDFQLGSGLF